MPINDSINGFIIKYSDTTDGYYSSIPQWSSIEETVPNNKLILDGEGADVVIDGTSLRKTLTAIQDRLCILEPDLKKLEKYEALRKAYTHYKLMEKLLTEKE